MTTVVCDASVVIKWFHSEDETEVAEARALLHAHRTGAVQARVLDLTFYEVGNVTIGHGLAPEETSRRLDDLQLLCGEPIALTPRTRSAAATLASRHALTFYDAAYLAVAEHLEAVLATADSDLMAAGGESPSTICRRLKLPLKPPPENGEEAEDQVEERRRR